ncbi:hypothetical protein T4A_13895 [Trichinella pseudospiralis]|uniref:Uncharacterized protein n=1 Tax=Trichinella pseudospiralis TaxID=6337 RepID=A0A0V1E3A8_TRIPS|nr:hypothetical protein T4A_13895 [Trichinella pseudospiralis]
MLVGVRCAVLVNWRFPEVFGETEIQDLQEGCKSIHFTYKVHLAVRFNAPKKDTLRCVIISKGALVCLTYVASGSVAKRSLSKVNEAKKGESANDTKQIMDDT